MPNEPRGRLDHAIDRAVRGMMQVDPAPGLRHRVADRLAAPRRRWTLAAMATATLAIVVALAAALFRPAAPQPGVEPPVALTSSPPAAPAIPGPAPVRPPAVTPPSARPVRAREATATAAPHREDVIFGTTRGHVSAANVRPATVSGRSDAPAAAAELPDDFFLLPPIAVTPISIAPIVIPPMTVRPLSVRK